MTCIGDALKNTGQGTYSEKIHDARMSSGWYVKTGRMNPVRK